MLRVVSRALAACLALWALCGAAGAQEIWFAPHAPGKFYHGPRDWDRVFRPDAPWQTAASHVRVFIESPGYFDFASDDELKTAAAFLAQRGAAFGVGLQGITKVPGETCGGMEGYGSAEAAELLAIRFARLGIRIAYVEPDEPVWFGHFETDARACRLTIDETARRVARTLRGFLRHHPDAVLGTIEPAPPLTGQPGWREAMTAFRTILEAELGHKVRHLHVDVGWRVPTWPRHLADIAAYAREHGLRLGLVYNGEGGDADDAAWMAHARRNFEVIESRLGIVPDVAAFVSWDVQPERVLPETDPLAHTSLILSYLRERTLLAVERRADRLAGRLVGATGQPLGGAAIAAWSLGVEPDRPPPAARVEGTVPEAARSAVFSFGINRLPRATGDNDVLMGDFVYRDGDGEAPAFSLADAIARNGGRRPVGVDAADIAVLDGARYVRLTVREGQRFFFNAPRFAVAPGTSFRLEGRLASILPTGMFGNIDIVWFDDKGRDFWRTPLYIGAAETPLGGARTDADGRFEIPVPPGRRPTARLMYPGDDRRRGAHTEWSAP